MISPSSSTFLLVLFFPIVSHLATTSTTFYPLFTACSDDNYTSESPYASNLHFLLANLISTTPKTRLLLFNKNYGVPDSGEMVYGVAHCRLDASSTTCSNCLNQTASAALTGSCAGRRSAIFRYDYCFLRYADHFFYSDRKSINYTHNFQPESATNPSAFKKQMDIMLEELSVATASSEVSFAVCNMTYELHDEAPMEVYGLAWCTMQSREDCYLCLTKGLEGYKACCLDQLGGSVATDYCAILYENRPFFNLSLLQIEAPPTGNANGTGSDAGNKRRNIIIISAIAAVTSLALILCAVIIIHGRFRKTSDLGVEEHMEIPDPLLLPFVSLKIATNNFSNENKLGEGRFGPSYKGVLQDGRPVVVSRLSKSSQKGLSELRKEVALVTQLQHKNLVKLLGYCLENKEKLFVYEYLPNACLDEHLFDPARREKLNWKKRLTIIEGTARGLVYLHNHSRLRIIHRDLNAKNILLDDNMKPKISDFDLARLVGSNESQLNTKLIAGTFGYMAPEYAMRGVFSTKSDVFSYGMVVLEIITGRRNCSFVESGNSLNLQTFVWQHWHEGSLEEVIDPGLGGRYHAEEALKCLLIGLLCIQAEPVERPSMSTVMLFLSSDPSELPSPSFPAFYTGGYPPSEPSRPTNSVVFNLDSPSSRSLSRINSY